MRGMSCAADAHLHLIARPARLGVGGGGATCGTHDSWGVRASRDRGERTGAAARAPAWRGRVRGPPTRAAAWGECCGARRDKERACVRKPPPPSIR